MTLLRVERRRDEVDFGKGRVLREPREETR